MKQRLLATALLAVLSLVSAPRVLAFGGSANISNVQLNGVPIFSNQDLLNDTNLAPNPVIVTGVNNLTLSFDAWGDSNISSIAYTFSNGVPSTTAFVNPSSSISANTGPNVSNTVSNSTVFAFTTPGIWQGTLALTSGLLVGPLAYQGPSALAGPESEPVFTLDLNVIPEPASALALATAALSGLVSRRRRS